MTDFYPIITREGVSKDSRGYVYKFCTTLNGREIQYGDEIEILWSSGDKSNHTSGLYCTNGVKPPIDGLRVVEYHSHIPLEHNEEQIFVQLQNIEGIKARFVK